MQARVREVVLQNFKSYEGTVKIGPFRKFTCVVGPNGAGKSNLMEAISFVLGLRTRHLRGERLQDLVHRKEGETEAEALRPCSVELHLEEGEETVCTVFRRVILPATEARFQINGLPVTQEEYTRRLESINILSQARNFLVFQGDVEAAAQRHGKELTALFEQVSGSCAFREEYDRLAAEKEKKELEARSCFSRKAVATQEKRQIAREKEEADRFRNLEAERRQIHTEFYLFRFHCGSFQAQQLNRNLAALETDRLEAEAALSVSRSRLEAAEQERAKAQLGANSADKSLASTRAKVAKVSPEEVQVRSKLEVLRNRLQDLESHAERDELRVQQLASQLKTLREKKQELEAELEAAGAKASSQLNFTEAQRREFERVRAAAEQKTAASCFEVRELDSQIRLLASERMRAERDSQEATVQRDHLRLKLQDLTEKEKNAAIVVQRHGVIIQKRLAEIEVSQASDHAQREERQRLLQQRQASLKDIQDFTATERQIENDRRLARVCADLSAMVQGARGRVLDLCQPSQRRLHVAVNVALAGHLDSVVTDTADAARQCVRHLKERMLEPMTFLPLDNLRVPPPDQRLQEALRGQHGIRSALSCVTFDVRYGRAFEFLLGDVVIADSLEVGRRFVFGECRQKDIHCRLVTVDGETISRDGNMSVNSEAAKRGGTRFDFASLEAAKSRLEALDRRIYELQVLEANNSGNRSASQEEAFRLESLRREAELTLQRTREELASKKKALEEVEASASSLEPKAARLLQEETALRDRHKELETRIGAETKSLFAALSKELGVDDIRRVEAESRRAREAARLRENDLILRLGNVKAELAMVEHSIQERKHRSPKKAAADNKAEAVALETKHRELLGVLEALQSDIDRLTGTLQEKQESQRAFDQAAGGQRQECREKAQRLAEANKRVAGLTAELRTIRERRANLLRMSVVEGARGIGDASAAEALQLLAAGGFESEDPSLDVAVDLGQLPEAKRAITGGPAAELLEEEYRAELHRLSQEMEQLRPNFKASEEMKQALGKALDATADAVEAKNAVEDTKAQFEAVKKARRARFMACFEQVKAAIGPVYRKLTMASGGAGSDGGCADLDLEDMEDPYLGGIKFIAMPPTKRYSDIALLSGGERSLAAMALLFAIQIYQRPPFLVLDEVDAYLDAANVQALAHYISQSEYQTIVISQKDQFFCKSEGLVGISKDTRRETSVVFSMDLNRLRDPGRHMIPLQPPPDLLAGAGG